jgi:hypothetical protein
MTFIQSLIQKFNYALYSELNLLQCNTVRRLLQLHSHNYHQVYHEKDCDRLVQQHE